MLPPSLLVSALSGNQVRRLDQNDLPRADESKSLGTPSDKASRNSSHAGYVLSHNRLRRHGGYVKCQNRPCPSRAIESEVERAIDSRIRIRGDKVSEREGQRHRANDRRNARIDDAARGGEDAAGSESDIDAESEDEVSVERIDDPSRCDSGGIYCHRPEAKLGRFVVVSVQSSCIWSE